MKIRLGPFKGYRGRVVDATDSTVRIELESQMKVVTGAFPSGFYCLMITRNLGVVPRLFLGFRACVTSVEVKGFNND